MTGLARGTWPRILAVLWVATSLALIVTPTVSDPALPRWWTFLTGLTVVSIAAAAVRRPGADLRWLGRLAVILPAPERPAWRAEVEAVLHASGSGRERARQALGFLIALPATALTCRRLHHARAPRHTLPRSGTP